MRGCPNPVESAIGARGAGRNHPDLLASIGEDDDVDPTDGIESNGYKPSFTLGRRVLAGQRHRVEENGFRITESDTVLRHVGSRLSRVPRHANICIVCISSAAGKLARIGRSNVPRPDGATFRRATATDAFAPTRAPRHLRSFYGRRLWNPPQSVQRAGPVKL